MKTAYGFHSDPFFFIKAHLKDPRDIPKMIPALEVLRIARDLRSDYAATPLAGERPVWDNDANL